MEMMLWNVALTGILAVIGFMARAKFEELDRIAILLNKTREEIARDHVTRAEINQTLDRLADKIEASIQRLENKIDQINQKA